MRPPFFSNSEESPRNTNSVYFHLHTDCVSCAGLSPNGGFQMNFDLVLRRIRELNVLAGEGESFVQATGTGAKLAKKDPIQLRLYRNGIVMFDGPFRSYQEHSTQQCMQDLMDGYFPSELQQRFPDGIPFEVRLCSTFSVFCGKESTNSVGFMPGLIRTHQFLNKLPKVVVKAGNVFDIRGSLRRTLQVSSRDPSFTLTNPNLRLTNTPVLSSGTQKIDSDKPAQAVVTLKLKSEDGNLTYVMKMSLSETVGQLRAYLDKHRWKKHPCELLTSVKFNFHKHVVSRCSAEGQVSRVMTSSVHIHAAALAMTIGPSSPVDSQETSL
uniref:UBX domain-containing protein 11 n=1 Tax=Poecilia reticulata TaxID=8081 RepID=A0A3P9NVD0_POERE